LLLYNRVPAVRIIVLTYGAKGTRTPDPLLANNRQHVHPRPFPQVTVPGRAPGSARVRTGCGTFLLCIKRFRPGRTGTTWVQEG